MDMAKGYISAVTAPLDHHSVTAAGAGEPRR